MFKAWQIFVFSLVPLALVFMGVIGGSFHGKDSRKEIFNPPPAQAAAPGGGTLAPVGGAVPPGGTSLPIVAKDQKFNLRTMTAPANARVTVVLDNQDPTVTHNFSVYKNNRATDPMTPGSTSTVLSLGPGVQPFSFTTATPGTYYFRCDVHPDTMNGSFIVR